MALPLEWLSSLSLPDEEKAKIDNIQPKDLANEYDNNLKLPQFHAMKRDYIALEQG